MLHLYLLEDTVHGVSQPEPNQTSRSYAVKFYLKLILLLHVHVLVRELIVICPHQTLPVTSMLRWPLARAGLI